MSLTQLDHPESQPSNLYDDLESFLYVLLYHSIYYQASKFSKHLHSTIGRQLEAVLGQCDIFDGHLVVDTTGKRGFFQFTPSYFTETTLRGFLNCPLTDLIDDLRFLFVPLYTNRPLRASFITIPSADKARNILKLLEPVLDLFKHYLSREGWDPNDKSDIWFNQSSRFKVD